MARTKGSNLEHALEIKRRIIALASDGLKQGDIARQVGKHRSYVSRVLKQFSSGELQKHERKVAALQTAVELKNKDSYLGPHTLAFELNQLGFSEDEIPANATLFKKVKAESSTWKPLGGKGDNRSYHSYFRGGLTASCQRFQLDGAGPFNFGGQRVYAFVCKDVFSRYVYAELVPHKYGPHLQPFIRRCVDAMGIPEELQTDNAVTWTVQQCHPGKLVWSFLQAGVKRVHFIPDAQPTRNGGVERMNGTLVHEWLRHHLTETGYNFPSLEAAQESLVQYLTKYNHHRQHRSLPIRSGSRRFHLTPGQVHKKNTERWSTSEQSIAFTRFMFDPGYCVLHSSVVAACPEYALSYLTWQCNLDGSGTLLYKGQEVGQFVHSFTNKHAPQLVIVPTDVKGQTPDREKYAFNPYKLAKDILDKQRHVKPRLQFLPKDYRYEEYENGCTQRTEWRIIDTRDGAVLFDSLNMFADHIKEFLDLDTTERRVA